MCTTHPIFFHMSERTHVHKCPCWKLLLLRATTLTYWDLLIRPLFLPAHDRLHFHPLKTSSSNSSYSSKKSWIGCPMHFFLLDHNQLYLNHFTTWNFHHRNLWSVHYQVHIWIHLLVKRIFLGFLKTTYSSKPYWSNSFHSLLSILWTTSVLNLLDFCSLQIFIWCLLTPVDMSAWLKNI